VHGASANGNEVYAHEGKVHIFSSGLGWESRALSHIRTMTTFAALTQANRKAWQLLKGPLAGWFVPAAALTLALAALGWYGISAAAEHLSRWLLSQGEWSADEAWLQTLTEWMLWLALLVVKLKLTKYIVLVVMGPLFAAVSEAAEAQITGQTVAFSWSRWIKDAVRGMRSALALATFEWTLTLGLWVAGLTIPVLSPVTLPLAWLVGAWAYGASAMDYVWEREGKGARSGLVASLKRPAVAFGVGIPFALWMAIPVLAWTVGPMMGGMGAAATASVLLKGGEEPSAQAVMT
jgi:uncharacterized protein involved in cysteine biosynthesis